MRIKRAVDETAQAVLKQLTAGLFPGQSRKIDGGGGYMPLHVEALEYTPSGPLYSVAHYYEQNGDLVPDPDVVFLRTSRGSFYPVSFQNAIAYHQAIRFGEQGELHCDPRQCAELVSFANMFCRNIKAQQPAFFRSAVPAVERL